MGRPPGRRPVTSITPFQFRHNLFRQYLYRQLGEAQRRQLHGEVAAGLKEIGGDDARRRVALHEVIQLYEAALAHWQQDDAAGRAELQHRLGETLLVLGRSPEAGNRFSETEQLYAHAGDRSGQGAALRLMGHSYWEQGDRARALDHYHRALALLEQEATPSVPSPRCTCWLTRMKRQSSGVNGHWRWPKS